MMAEKRKEAVHQPKGQQSREQTFRTVACPDGCMASRRAQAGGFVPKARFDREPVPQYIDLQTQSTKGKTGRAEAALGSMHRSEIAGVALSHIPLSDRFAFAGVALPVISAFPAFASSHALYQRRRDLTWFALLFLHSRLLVPLILSCFR